MAEYYTPGVYTEKLKNTSIVIEGVSTSVAAFVGIAKRGKVGKAEYVTSWTDYVNKFAGGLNSPFFADSYLGLCIYSFFNNGGSRCYISRVAHNDVATATLSVTGTPASAGATAPTILFSAKDEGEWANNLKVICTANTDFEGTYDLTFKLGSNVETITQLSNVEGNERYFVDYLKVFGSYAYVVTGTALFAFEEKTFTGGNDGEANVTDSDYLEALNVFDSVDDATIFAIPGQTSDALRTGFIDYIDKHEFTVGILDAPMGTVTATDMKILRKKINCERAILINTWHRVNDPLSDVSGKYRTIPSSGAYAGIAARTIEKIGPWKAPAGTDAKVNGAIELVWDANKGDTDMMNPLGIVSIVTKPNYGIVVWGARSVSNDSNYKYVSDILMDIYLRRSVQLATQPFVFEPNEGDGDANLWNRIIASCEGFLEYVRLQGGLKGKTSAESYYVKCDAELNPEPMVQRGYCITEIGYASKKPAEFVVFRFKNSLS